jgi:hypothetical protein
MGVQPPADDSEEPTAIEFGIAALDAKLGERSIEYPATEREVREQVGQVEIPYDTAGHTITVAEALDEATVAQFDSERDLLNALHPTFERKREATSNSLLTQLRALVPF